MYNVSYYPSLNFESFEYIHFFIFYFFEQFQYTCLKNHKIHVKLKCQLTIMLFFSIMPLFLSSLSLLMFFSGKRNWLTSHVLTVEIQVIKYPNILAYCLYYTDTSSVLNIFGFGLAWVTNDRTCDVSQFLSSGKTWAGWVMTKTKA